MVGRVKCHHEKFAVAAMKYNDLMQSWVFRTLDAVVVLGIVFIYVIGVLYAYNLCKETEPGIYDYESPMEQLYSKGDCICNAVPSYSNPNVRVPLMRVNYPDGRDMLETCAPNHNCTDRFKRCMNHTLFSMLVLVQTAHKVFKRHPVKQLGVIERHLDSEGKDEAPPTTQKENKMEMQ